MWGSNANQLILILFHFPKSTYIIHQTYNFNVKVVNAVLPSLDHGNSRTSSKKL